MENLEQFAKQRLDFNRQKISLKESQQERLTVSYNGGMFRVTLELMSFLASWPADNDLYLEDLYENPVAILDPQELLYKCRMRWQEVMNDWHNQLQDLRKVRKIDQL